MASTGHTGMHQPHAVHLSGSISGLKSARNFIASSRHGSLQLLQMVPCHAIHFSISISTEAFMKGRDASLNTPLSQAFKHSSQNVQPLFWKRSFGVPFSHISIISSSHTLAHGFSSHSGQSLEKRSGSLLYGGRTGVSLLFFSPLRAEEREVKIPLLPSSTILFNTFVECIDKV